jgi:hypothetical protein
MHEYTPLCLLIWLRTLIKLHAHESLTLRLSDPLIFLVPIYVHKPILNKCRMQIALSLPLASSDASVVDDGSLCSIHYIHPTRIGRCSSDGKEVGVEMLVEGCAVAKDFTEGCNRTRWTRDDGKYLFSRGQRKYPSPECCRAAAFYFVEMMALQLALSKSASA